MKPLPEVGSEFARPGRFGLSLAQWDQLADFSELLRERNLAHNLVSRRDIKNLWSRHVLDCLRLTPELKTVGKVLDIGSGGGLPGLVLAIACPDARFVLAERMTRKARFLATACRHLALANVDVQARDAGDVQETGFDAVTARAVASPERLWPLAEPRLAPTGALYVFVGGDAQPWQNPPGTERRELNEPDAEGGIWMIRTGSDAQR